MALYLNILTVVLLALVAGLLVMLSLQLKTWRKANAQAPLLAETLTEAILSARRGLAELKHEIVAQGPEVGRLTTEAGKLRVELQFLIQRGTQMAERLDVREHALRDEEDDDLPVVRLAPAVQAVVEQVAVANGLAAKPMRDVAGQDPLEELLAGLQAEPEPIRKDAGKRKRVGPVTQAELDLQQSLKGTV
jgi:hypothetical protein